MPYNIVEFPDGYRVQSDNGTWLSKRALSLDMAEKQLTALNIQYSRKVSGGKGVNISYPDFIKEHTKLLSILKNPTKKALNAEYHDQSKELKRIEQRLRGGDIPASVISRETLGRMAEDAYEAKPSSGGDGWMLILNTPTIKAYKKYNYIIVAVRGTKPTDKRDLLADANVAISNVANSDRYKEDKAIVTQLKSQYPRTKMYAVGHSLGGAIVDNLIQDGLVKEGMSFNPAVEQRFYNDGRNKRISHAEDPLYNLITKNATGVEVVNTPIAEQKLVNTGIGFLDNLANATINRYVPADKVLKGKKAHSVGSIFGRGACGKNVKHCKCSDGFKKQLEDDGYSCDKYLKDAQAVARQAGYDASTLTFANDKVHKLCIVAPDGSVRAFGRVKYGDFLIWSHLEHMKKVPKGYALTKRGVFHKSHEKIKGNWRSDKYSPNNLALHILW